MVRCLLQGRIYSGPHSGALVAELAQQYAPSAVHLVNYGHQAIQIALSMFKRERPNRSQVIVPAYICPSVIRAVTDCGLQVRSVDVQDDLNMSPADIQAALTVHTLAVIAPHMYGAAAQIAEIELICDAAQVFLIDDAAQVAGVRQDGRLLGCFGDVGVMSFAQSKTIVTGIKGSGGVLLINRARWAVEASQACAALPMAQGRLCSLLDFLWNYVGHAYTGHSGYYISRLLSALGWQGMASTTATQISNLDAAIALAQINSLDVLVRERVRIAHAYHHALQHYPRLLFPQYATGRFLARVMLLVPDGVDMARFRSEALNRGVETRGGYPVYLPRGIEAPRGEAMAQRLVGVPCRSGMSQAEVERICSVLDASLPVAKRCI